MGIFLEAGASGLHFIDELDGRGRSGRWLHRVIGLISIHWHVTGTSGFTFLGPVAIQVAIQDLPKFF